jgi:DHA2 family multidrug resistance protein-like MFS transporter
VSETGYELGTALGIALLGSVLTAVYQADLTLPGSVPSDVAAAATESPGEGFEAMKGLATEVSAPVTEAIHAAFTHALQVTTWVGAAVLIVGAVVTWRLLPGRREAVNEMASH